MKKLNAKEKKSLIDYFNNGYTVDELSSLFDITPAAVKKIINGSTDSVKTNVTSLNTRFDKMEALKKAHKEALDEMMREYEIEVSKYKETIGEFVFGIIGMNDINEYMVIPKKEYYKLLKKNKNNNELETDISEDNTDEDSTDDEEDNNDIAEDDDEVRDVNNTFN